jgi:hypothetical protein
MKLPLYYKDTGNYYYIMKILADYEDHYIKISADYEVTIIL